MHIGRARGETGVLDEHRPAAGQALKGSAPSERKQIVDHNRRGKIRPASHRECRAEYLARRRTDEASDR